jgi:hypothetical protein
MKIAQYGTAIVVLHSAKSAGGCMNSLNNFSHHLQD